MDRCIQDMPNPLPKCQLSHIFHHQHDIGNNANIHYLSANFDSKSDVDVPSAQT